MKPTRREFVVLSAAATAASAVGPLQAATTEPWYRRVRRWGQINITEDDGNMDIGFWRRYLKDTDTQGTIINSGGVVNYYDSKSPAPTRGSHWATATFWGNWSRPAMTMASSMSRA